MVVGATADPVVLAQIRAKARSILDALERETEDDEELHPSWVRGGGGRWILCPLVVVQIL